MLASMLTEYGTNCGVEFQAAKLTLRKDLDSWLRDRIAEKHIVGHDTG